MSIFCVSIYDSNKSKISENSIVNILWSAVMFASNIIYCNFNSQYLRFYLRYKDESIQNKYNFFQSVLCKNMPEDYRQEVDETMDYYLKMKNKRKQGRKQLVTFKKLEKVLLEGIESEIKRYFNQKYKLDPLIPFSGFDKDNTIVLCQYNGDYDQKNVKTDQFVENIYNTINYDNNVPFFDGCIEELAKNESLESKHVEKILSNKELSFIKVPLYIIPPLQSLDSQQLQILRNEFQKEIRPLLLTLLGLNIKLRKIEYADIRIKSLSKEFSNNMYPKIDDLQKWLDENIYIEMLKSRNTDNKRYMVNLGISSYNHLVDLYKAIDFIDDNLGIYAKEKLQKEADLDNCRMFLYLTEV